MEILRVENLSFTYSLSASETLRNISFSVEHGDFIGVCGATGSGKSTLLRMLKRELIPLGKAVGNTFYKNVPLEDLDAKTSACKIGFVMQRPEQQLVTDKVWHELAFGLENMALPSDTIRRRVSEMACYFGIESWFDKKVSELSGGQKQLLNLASVMVMQPDVLILDEPTAQLDPIAAADFISTVKKLNRELGLTVIIAEHRLEEVIPVCDKLLVMENGSILIFDETYKAVSDLRGKESILCAMPAAVRLFSRFDISTDCPVTVREGRRFLEENFSFNVKSLEREYYSHSSTPALEISDGYFRYRRELSDVLHGLDMTVYEGEIYCILGGNGSGKTTALSVCAGLNRLYSGKIKVFGKALSSYKGRELYQNCVALLPQDVQTVFLKNTVREELSDVNADYSTLPYDISPLLDMHPYDLSGGQQQLVALAKVLASKPRLLLLDEPTKGIDANAKLGIISILKKLKAEGMTIIIVTHDVEFAAMCADRCALFFRGSITSCDVPHRFFSENNFYTTAINRMTRHLFCDAVTVEDAYQLCLKNSKA